MKYNQFKPLLGEIAGGFPSRWKPLVLAGNDAQGADLAVALRCRGACCVAWMA
jgi:hypothetical protein